LGVPATADVIASVRQRCGLVPGQYDAELIREGKIRSLNRNFNNRNS
jgi:hypothetical protein